MTLLTLARINVTILGCAEEEARRHVCGLYGVVAAAMRRKEQIFAW